MMAWVWAVRRRSTSATGIWKVDLSAGTTVNFAPLLSTNGRYSGKKGATAMISAPSTARARITEIRAGAAPQVRNRFSGRMSAWNRSFRSAATAVRASMLPGAGV